MTKQEIKALEEMERRNKLRKKNGWKNDEIEELAELEQGVDIVVIDKDTREVRARGIWCDIKNIARIRNLIARESASWGEGREAVAVSTGTVGLWEHLKDEQIVNI